MKFKNPSLTGIIMALIVSSFAIGGFFLVRYNFSGNNGFEGNIQQQVPLSINTTFSTYNLQGLNYSPSIIPTKIKPGLMNVNLQGLNDELTPEIKKDLEKYGFALVDKRIEDIYEPMDFDMNTETPMYITTDLCLHTLHSLFDNYLRILEYHYFNEYFASMISTLRDNQMALYEDTEVEQSLKPIIEKNIAYLTVIISLLNNETIIPNYVENLVNTELENINLGMPTYSSIFGYLEDFSQYKPRGHYTRNEELKQYFQAMMYAGRMKFILDDKTEENTLGIEQTKMALLLVYSLSAKIDNQVIWDYWDKIVRTTSFLVGVSDDLTPKEYFEVWLNQTEENITLSPLIDDNFVKELIAKLQELRAPKINSRFTATFEGEENSEKGMSLFGQSYTPDAYIFQELVYDNLPTRMFPKGLDIFSVFGSKRAEYHLASEKEYEGYEDKITELRDEFGNLSFSDWTQNFYWQWLFTLLPLLEEKGEGYPGYMQNDAWTDKSLMTALASWAELKHDTILYAKQAYAAKLALPEGTYNYVEPYPEIYSRIAATISMLKEGLESRGLLYSDTYNDFESKFDDLITIMNNLTTISIKELENQPITEFEQYFIRTTGKNLLYISIISGETGEELTTETDKRTAIIADVFTEPNSGQVLEVGVGNPYLIYVVVQDHKGKLYLTRGVTFSYYEFKQPMNNRLTDEEWQEMLETSPPELPEWIRENLPLTTIEDNGNNVKMIQMQCVPKTLEQSNVKRIKIIILYNKK
ncbi:MAG: DUF3160 domain-containing protein [Candidatus Heimdallarchaeum endolithica]|uniref:DUF3160 domain-containing protein n=1 Tax=Candidatus Heimdallarchaeum endolithica TaxID=2876572 RepID=A0A9Y1FPK1_9ARCH|nr:MAG: DUF3160 domain-containing protein [Candidatus Heimdallarchaeum endolithica]